MSKFPVGLMFVMTTQLLVASLTAPVPVSSKGETVVSSRLGNLAIEARIRTHELPNGTAASPVKPTDSACTMSRVPCSIVDGLDIAIAGEPIFVPRSAFADLADLSSAKLAIEHGKYVLVLVGGDASESYVVRIAFDRRHVTYRSLTSGEFPEHPLQETIYHLNRLGLSVLIRVNPWPGS